MFTIIKGRGNQNRAAYINDEWNNRNKNEKEFLVLVPEQSTLQTEEQLIKEFDTAGLMLLEVLSFKRLGDRLISENQEIKETNYIDNLGKMMLVRKILENESKDLILFKKAYKKEGFLLETVKLLDELRRNETPVELLEVCIKKLDKDPLTKQKFKDIARIYEVYNTYFETSFNDELDYNRLYIDAIQYSDDLKNKVIWIMDFDGFTALEMKIIEAVANKGVDVKVILDFEEENEIFLNVQNTSQRIIERLSELGIDTQIIENPYVVFQNEELNALEKYYYLPEKRGAMDVETSRTTLWYGKSPYEEVEKLAAKITQYIQSGQYSYRDIGIVTNQMETYLPIIKRTFSEFNIPYFNDEKRKITSNPAIKLIMSSLDICLKNFRYEDVFRYLKTDLLDLDLELMYVFENYALQYGIRGNRWLKPFEYEFNYLESIESLREEIIMPLKELNESIRQSKIVRDQIDSIKLFLNTIDFEKCLENKIEVLYDNNWNDYAQEYEQIREIIETVFDQLELLLGEATMSLKELRSLLESGFAEYEIGLIPTTIDEVIVGSIDRIKHRQSKITFLVGTNDGAIPKNFQDSGILLDDEKMILKDAGVPIYSDIATLMREDRMSFYKVLATTSDYLEISYTLSNIDGKAMRESILIPRLKELLVKIPEHTEIQKTERDEYLLEKIAYKNLIKHLRLSVDGIELESKWANIYQKLQESSKFENRPEQIFDALYYDNRQEAINPYQVKKLYPSPIQTSISRIEKFIACPFSHFVRYGLRPKERKEYELKAPEIGEFFHQSIENFSKQIHIKKKKWKDLSNNEIEKTVEEVIDELAPRFSNDLLSSSEKNKYALKRLERICKRATHTLVEHVKMGDFEPALFEAIFENILIELPTGEIIELKGRIDRVDIGQDGEQKYVKVIDYKSGHKKFSLSDVYNGLELQLVVYLDQAMEMLKKRGEFLPGGCLYFKIDDPMVETIADDGEIIEKNIMKALKMSGIVLKDLRLVQSMDHTLEEGSKSDIIPVEITKKEDFSKRSSALELDEFEGLIKYTKQKLIESAEKIVCGNMEIEPYKDGDNTPCQYCDYKSICQFDTKFKNAYRKVPKLTDEEILKVIKTSKNEGEC